MELKRFGDGFVILFRARSRSGQGRFIWYGATAQMAIANALFDVMG